MEKHEKDSKIAENKRTGETILEFFLRFRFFLCLSLNSLSLTFFCFLIFFLASSIRTTHVPVNF